MVRRSWGIFRQIDFISSKGGINEKKLQSMSFQLLPPKDVIIKSSGMKDSETSIRHEFVTISSRRGGVIDCCDLSFFQLSLLGKGGGANLKYA